MITGSALCIALRNAEFMSWVTVIWSMVASACLTLAVIYFLVWWSNRTAWANLLFAMTAASTAAFTLCELRQMRVGTSGELLSAMRWTHVALLGVLVSTTWFVTFYLGAGRRWLAWTVSGLRVFYLLVAFLIWGNVNYLEITSLRRVPFLGDSVTVFEGIPNPWMLFGYATMLLILIFVADASVTAWRRGERRKALMIGGSVEFFLLLGTVQAALVHWAQLPIPVLIAPLYLGLVVVMGSELSRDVLRASRLVHELQASEAGLRESEARMSLAVDAADLGIWIRDLARNEIWASHKWRELFGFAPSEPLEFNAILQRLHPDDREGLRQAHAMAVAGADGGKYQTEYRLMLPDGATRWISSQGRVEFDATGQPVLIRGAARDVTARKQAEQETQLLRQEIAHAGRVSMMGQLASGLAHEINQPLASILRNAEAAELFLQHPSPDLDEIRAILSDIRSDDERAGHVIDRMRGLLKRQTLDTGRLDVGALVGDVAALVRIDAATRQVKLDVDVPADLPHVRGDRVQIQQVLLNLILNGMDALHGTRLEDRRVDVTARPMSHGRADHRDRRRRRGARHSCRQAGADLRPVFHDQAERHGHRSGGLPHDRRGAQRATVGREQERRRRGISFHAADRGGGRRRMNVTEPTVHIVDDDAPFLAATSRLLRASGFAVRTFGSASDFLTQRAEDAPGCVLADVRMPGMNGLELQSALARSSNPLPILFLTGHGDIPSSVRAMRDGAEDFLEKRAAKAHLLEAVKRALARDAREREARNRQRELRARFGTLTAREFEVLGHVVRGKLNKQIAGDLGIHERTVKLHRTAITTKLGVQSVAELTRLTDEAGLLTESKPTFPKGL